VSLRWRARRIASARWNGSFRRPRTTPIGRRQSGIERADLQFRAEFFNLFNIVNMGLPANTIRGSGFGIISKTAGTSRQIQFSSRLDPDLPQVQADQKQLEQVLINLINNSLDAMPSGGQLSIETEGTKAKDGAQP